MALSFVGLALFCVLIVAGAVALGQCQGVDGARPLPAAVKGERAARDVKREDVLAWIKDNKAGIIVALAASAIAGLAIHPALRVLADEVAAHLLLAA